MPRSDKRLAGRYQLSEAIGSGAFATVYRARDLRLGRDVAVKVLLPNHRLDPILTARFDREARALAALSHPNVVAVHDVGPGDDDGSEPFMVMDLCVDGSLADRLADSDLGWLEPDDLVPILVDVAAGLDALHARGIIHRDLKPSNILLGDGRARIADLGIALAEPSDLTMAGTTVGTVAFLAPEQLAGQPASTASDVHALGVVAHLGLTGVLPRPAGSLAEIVAASRVAPPLVSQVRPELGISFDAPVAAALSRSPGERPTAHELGTALAAAQGRRTGRIAIPRTGSDPGLRPAAAGVGALPSSVGPSGVEPSGVRPSSVRPPAVEAPTVATLAVGRPARGRRRGWLAAAWIGAGALAFTAGAVVLPSLAGLDARRASPSPSRVAVIVPSPTPTPEPTPTPSPTPTPTPKPTASPDPNAHPGAGPVRRRRPGVGGGPGGGRGRGRGSRAQEPGRPGARGTARPVRPGPRRWRSRPGPRRGGALRRRGGGADRPGRVPVRRRRSPQVGRGGPRRRGRRAQRLNGALRSAYMGPVRAGPPSVSSARMKTILVIDDERNIVELLRLYLEKEGWAVISAGDGETGLELHRRHDPDLIVLDLMLPRIDGFEVCREVRRRGDTPILMLTARDDDVDSIVGLELGADDYVTKPFNPRALVARVKAILRRTSGAARGGRPIEVGDLRIDPRRREATVGDRRLELRSREFDLLAALARDPGVVMTRDALLEDVWGTDFPGETRTVDVHVAEVRRKLGDDGPRIETVRGLGYRLLPPAREDVPGRGPDATSPDGFEPDGSGPNGGPSTAG